jgi:hypothetical protein
MQRPIHPSYRDPRTHAAIARGVHGPVTGARQIPARVVARQAGTHAGPPVIISAMRRVSIQRRQWAWTIRKGFNDHWGGSRLNASGSSRHIGRGAPSYTTTWDATRPLAATSIETVGGSFARLTAFPQFLLLTTAATFLRDPGSHRSPFRGP